MGAPLSLLGPVGVDLAGPPPTELVGGAQQNRVVVGLRDMIEAVEVPRPQVYRENPFG